MTSPDHWVRQSLGNTGSVGGAAALGALKRIQANLSSGLFPTTGGAVSLMHLDDVDALYLENQGWFPKFRPQMPDRGGKRAKALDDWYVAAMEQALFHGPTPFDRRLVPAMDGFLHTYHSTGVDWKRVHAFALSRDARVASFGQGQNWTANAQPFSILAFVGSGSPTSATLTEGSRVSRVGALCSNGHHARCGSMPSAGCGCACHSVAFTPKAQTPCPECRMLLAPTEEGNRLRCVNPTCKIGWWYPSENRGMFKMPSLPSGVRWVSTGQGGSSHLTGVAF